MRTFRAPGRINLIGEHTDYNEGWVMPAAIEREARVHIELRADRCVRIHSAQFRDAAETNLDAAGSPSAHWSASLLGVARLLDERARGRLRGAELVLDSNVPIGAGLSSSAAAEVAVGFALAHAQDLAIEPAQLAELCQRASHQYAGARCGIMDFYIACFGRAGQLALLDTRSLEARWIRWPQEAGLLICDTGVRHDHARGAYNQRRSECESAVHYLQAGHPAPKALRDVSLDQLRAAEPGMDPRLFRRARHVVTENERVWAASAALARQDFAALGETLVASHLSLRDDFEVSCPELDAMVDLCLQQPGVYGARMMGGGFGGCALALVQPERIPRLRAAIAAAYAKSESHQPEIWPCHPSPGAGESEAPLDGPASAL
ncbi:MAG TPA: galactokinase [Terriglobales bacterium]|nr:galactokinase [Terriglobales bacterium]